MPHLNERFCPVPFRELAACPKVSHHAIGSPHFDAFGKPLFTDPVVISVHSDILEQKLPRCSALVASCNTKPYHSYGPVIRRVFESSRPHEFPEVRRGFEGVMEVGEVREISPGALCKQTEKILLACVTPMAGNTNRQIIDEVLKHLADVFAGYPTGTTMRMPIIGTGKAVQEKATEDAYRNMVHMTVSRFYHALLPANEYCSPRRLMLIHPFEYESRLITNALAEKGIFLSILDKMNLHTTDKRLTYGMAYSIEQDENVPKIMEALDHFDQALDKLLKGKRKPALQEAARGVEIEPDLGGLYIYISSLAQRRGLLDAIAKESLSLAESGRILDAFCVGHNLLHLGGKGKEKKFVSSMQNCYMDCCVAALEARLLYENYMEAQEGFDAVYRGEDFAMVDERRATLPAELVEDLKPLEYLREKIPQRIVENTFHIVIRKIMADILEVSGARRSLDNLLELQKHGKIDLNESDQEICRQLYLLIESVEGKGETPQVTLQHQALGKLLEVLPDHGTLRVEAARYYLKGGEKQGKTLSRQDLEKAWEFLENGAEKNPRDYGILSYLGFLISMQGQKFLPVAEEFYMLFARLIDNELSRGKFGIRKLKTPQGESVAVSIGDRHTKMAYCYYRQYHQSALLFAKLAKAIQKSEGTAAIDLYEKSLQSLEKIGRSDLAALYRSILGETWVALSCRSRHDLGTIPIPFVGEISLDLISSMYRKVRFWWKYKKIKSHKVRNAISQIIKKIGDRL